MKKTGMVVKIIGNSCIILTNDGEYKKVSLPESGVTRVGQIIAHTEKKKSFPYLRYFMVAASLLLIVLTGQLYFGRTQPAAAFMTIDINPSIELAILADKRVASARGLNSDGVTILEEIKVIGLDLREAAKLIVNQAIKDQFFVVKEDNIILVTLTGDNDKFVEDLESIYESIKNPVELNGLDTEVIIEPVEAKVRQEAEKVGISTGRYLLLQKSANKGVIVNVEEISAMSLRELEKDKKISIRELLSDYSHNRNNGDNRDNNDDRNNSDKRNNINNGVNSANNSQAEKNKKTERVTIKNIFKKQQNSKEDDGDKKDDNQITGKEKANSDNDKRKASDHVEKQGKQSRWD